MAVAINTYNVVGNYNAGTTEEPDWKNVWTASFECDTVADLATLDPTSASFAFPSVILTMPSTAHIIEGNLMYAMKSDGTWVIQDEASRMNVYTKPEIDSMLEDYTTTADQNLIDAAQDADITKLELATTELIDSGAKNQLYFDSINTDGSKVVEHNGVTFTINSDGTITANGTASATVNAFVFLRISGTTVKIDDLCDGNHMLFGAPSGASSSTYRMYVYSSGYTQSEYGSGLLLPSRGSASNIEVACFVSKGTHVDNIVFRPMIALKTLTDISTVSVPYRPSWDQMYQTNTVQNAALAELINTGHKNLMLLSGSDVTGYGIQCTFDYASGTITLDGVNQDKKCTGSFNIQCADSRTLGLVPGKVYNFSCGGYECSNDTIGLYVYTSGATPLSQFDCYTNNIAAWNTDWEQASGFRLFIRSGTVVDNVVLKPMICAQAYYEISDKFVPYTP